MKRVQVKPISLSFGEGRGEDKKPPLPMAIGIGEGRAGVRLQKKGDHLVAFSLWSLSRLFFNDSSGHFFTALIG